LLAGFFFVTNALNRSGASSRLFVFEFVFDFDALCCGAAVLIAKCSDFSLTRARAREK